MLYFTPVRTFFFLVTFTVLILNMLKSMLQKKEAILNHSVASVLYS